jgi:hypothetical protein
LALVGLAALVGFGGLCRGVDVRARGFGKGVEAVVGIVGAIIEGRGDVQQAAELDEVGLGGGAL